MTEHSGHTTGPRCPECGREPDLGVDEPVTHCEWCGAEYPIPGQDAVPAEERQINQHAAKLTES
jgi:hypothetical protein